jgi:hypothetical protein
MTTLLWVSMNRLTRVATFGEFTYVLTRDLSAGKRNRFSCWVVCHQRSERLACECTPGHSQRLAGQHANLMLQFGDILKPELGRIPTWQELKFHAGMV